MPLLFRIQPPGHTGHGRMCTQSHTHTITRLYSRTVTRASVTHSQGRNPQSHDRWNSRCKNTWLQRHDQTHLCQQESTHRQGCTTAISPLAQRWFLATLHPITSNFTKFYWIIEHRDSQPPIGSTCLLHCTHPYSSKTSTTYSVQ